MFGLNERVGQRHFAEEGVLHVTSCFVTLQGEGPFSGLPAVFVRLAKCNLACSFCDTYFDSGDWLTFDRLNDHLGDLVFETPLEAKDYVLVITGGEPLLQKELGEWLETQVGLWRNIQIESNGTLLQPLPDDVHLVVSPKCMEKRGVATRYLTPRDEVLERADSLKFVMCADPSSPYSSIPDWALDWNLSSPGDVFVSPMNVYAREPRKAKVMRTSNATSMEQRSTVEEVISFWEPGLLDLTTNQANHEHTARYAVANGLRFQVQAHLYAGMA